MLGKSHTIYVHSRSFIHFITQIFLQNGSNSYPLTIYFLIPWRIVLRNWLWSSLSHPRWHVDVDLSLVILFIAVKTDAVNFCLFAALQYTKMKILKGFSITKNLWKNIRVKSDFALLRRCEILQGFLSPNTFKKVYFKKRVLLVFVFAFFSYNIWS